MARLFPDFGQVQFYLRTQWGNDEGTYRQWNDANIEYSFPTAGFEGEKDETAIAMSADQLAYARLAFELWDDLIAIDLNEVANDPDAQITFAYAQNTNDDGTYASPDLGGQFDPGAPGGIEPYEMEGSQLWFSANALNPTWANQQAGMIRPWNQGFKDILHEIGHSLGLSHPGSYNGKTATPDQREFLFDNHQYTVMSYWGGYGSGIWQEFSGGHYPSTPRLFDVWIIQAMYGVDMTTRTGDTRYGFGSNAGRTFIDPTDPTGTRLLELYDFASYNLPGVGSFLPSFTIWDAGGRDMLDASQYAVDQEIDLREGGFSDIGGFGGDINAADGRIGGNIAIAFGAVIEDARGGSANDTIFGNDVANDISGLAGDDTVDGFAGNDVLHGGGGVDVLRGGAGDDTLTGGGEADSLYGGRDVDLIDGNGGDDVIDGGGSGSGGGPGATLPDILTGDLGNDTFIYAHDYRATVITDFNTRDGEDDRLDLSGAFAGINGAFANVFSFTELLSKGSQVGADIVFDLGNFNRLTLRNQTAASLDASQFRFAENPVGADGNYLLVANPAFPQSGRFTHTETASLADGGFVAATASLDTYSAQTIFGERFDDRGVKVGSFAVNSTPLNFGGTHGQVPQVARLTDGRIVAAWWSEDTANGGAGVFRARLFSNELAPLGDDFVVNSTPLVAGQVTGDAVRASALLIDLVPQSNGGFLIAWYSDENPNPNDAAFVVRQRVFDAAGQPTGNDVAVGSGRPPTPLLTDGFGLQLRDGGVLRYWVEGASRPYPPYDFIGYLYAQINGGEIVKIFEGPFNAIGDIVPAVELEDGRIQLTFSGYSGSGFNISSSGTSTIILDSDLKGFTRPGTANSDTLRGGIYNDRLYALGGNDTLTGGRGADILDGGEGIDRADYDASVDPVNVDLSDSAPESGGHAENDVLISVENVRGSNYGDAIVGDFRANDLDGSFGDDAIVGGGGNDRLTGGRGADTIDGGADDDIINGGAGNDTLSGAERDTVFGGDGVDTITLRGSAGVIASGGAGNDIFLVFANGAQALGEEGADDFRVEGNNNQITVGFLDASRNTVDVRGQSNVIRGSLGVDVMEINGGGSGNVLFGEGGNDEFSAVFGGAGNELHGDDGSDRIDGSPNNDLIWTDNQFSVSIDDFVDANDGDDTVVSSGGGDILSGDVGSDTLTLDLSWSSASLSITFAHVNLFVEVIGEGTRFAGFEIVNIILGSGGGTIDASASDYTGRVSLNGRLGVDTLTGGSGSDELQGGSGEDTLTGGGGDDFLYGDGDRDVMDGGDDNDVFNDEAGINNEFYGGSGADTIIYSNSSIYAALAENRIYRAFAGQAFVGAFDSGIVESTDIVQDIEKIVGSGYADQFYGATRSETFSPGLGNDNVVGGGGVDGLDYSNAGAYSIVADLVAGAVNEHAVNIEDFPPVRGELISTDSVAGIRDVAGTRNNDEIRGDALANVIAGGDGDDLLTGGGGDDTLNGGAHIDMADYAGAASGVTVSLAIAIAQNTGGAGSDRLSLIESLGGSAFADALTGDGGDNILLGRGGGDALVGGAGLDAASYADAAVGVTANLELGIGAGGDAQGDTYAGVENLIGSAFNDVLVGKAGVVNTMMGGDGANTFYAEGVDVLLGGLGIDTLFGGPGAALTIDLAAASIEIAWGGFLADTLDGSDATANLTLVGQGPTGDTMSGGSGNDFIYFRAGDVILGGTGNDWAVSTLSATGVTLDLVARGFENAWGSTSGDALTAASATGSIVLVGDGGADTLTGGNGADFLYGGIGADTLTGGGGNDNLVGDAGTDIFRFDANWGVDIVWGWANGVEKFTLTGSGATSFAQLTVNQNVGGNSGNALISFGANQILVVGAANQIDGSDFVF